MRASLLAAALVALAGMVAVSAQDVPPGGPRFEAAVREQAAQPVADTDGVTLVTALREQLGLRLDRQRAPVEVLVVDAIERPTPD